MDTSRESIGSARALALQNELEARAQSAAEESRSVALIRSVTEMLPFHLDTQMLPEGDVLDGLISEISESISRVEPGTSPERIADEIHRWLSDHPAERALLEKIVSESFGRRFERHLASTLQPSTDDEIRIADQELRSKLLAEHVPIAWIHNRMALQRKTWTSYVRSDHNAWGILEDSLPNRDVERIRKMIDSDSATLHSEMADLDAATKHLSDRVRHAIGAVASNAEKRRTHDALAALAVRTEPIRTLVVRLNDLERYADALNRSIAQAETELATARADLAQATRDAQSANSERRRQLYKPLGAAIAKKRGMEKRTPSIPPAKRPAFDAEYAAASALADEYERQYAEPPAIPSELTNRVENANRVLLALMDTRSNRTREGEATREHLRNLRTDPSFDDVRRAAAELPNATTDKQRGHREFQARHTFLGVKPTQDDWEHYLRQYEFALGPIRIPNT